MSDSAEVARKLQESLAQHMGNLKGAVDSEAAAAKKTKEALTTGIAWTLPEKAGKGEKMFSQVFGFKPKAPFRDFPVRVYEVSEWHEEVRPFIPLADEGFVFDTLLTVQAVLAVGSGDNTFLYGPKGSGKSSYPQEICARIGMPFIRVGMKEDMESGELLGTNSIVGTEIRWVDGPVTTVASHGGVLCLDEASNITPGAAIALHPLLEENRRLFLNDKIGTIAEKNVTIDPRFRVFLTDNTNLQGDITGKYVGTKVQNEAFIDRIFTSLFVGYMAPEKEIAMIQARVPSIPEDIATAMVRFADLIRKNYQQGTMQRTVSPRVLINWARKAVTWGDLNQAYRVAFGEGLNDDDKKLAAENYRKVFGA